jgi:hypothetical protein
MSASYAVCFVALALSWMSASIVERHGHGVLFPSLSTVLPLIVHACNAETAEVSMVESVECKVVVINQKFENA